MGGWWRSADLREGCALAHSGGRCAPERLRAWTRRDSGRVPLIPQTNAKDGEPRTQLAALRQVSAALQRILLQAKRKPAPGIQARRCPETHRRWELTELKARGYSLNSGSKLL